jgi:putative flippase GtrA
MKAMHHMLSRFMGVGVAAALTHMAVFGLLQTRMWPEWANALGFVVAFGVSFGGHRALSFAGTSRPVTQSLWRFVITALLGFAVNELVFVGLHRGLLWPSWLALIAGLVLAACQTFALSRFWAFKA